jgi:hypothetical protein
LGEKESSVVYGLKDFNSKDYSRCTVFAELSLKLAFKDWKAKVQQLNMEIATPKANVKRFTNQDCLVALGLIIGSADFSQVGKELFSRSEECRSLGFYSPSSTLWGNNALQQVQRLQKIFTADSCRLFKGRE